MSSNNVCCLILKMKRWLGGLEVRLLPRDRKVADSILTSGVEFKKNQIRDLS
jgi:hypothetical protein